MGGEVKIRVLRIFWELEVLLKEIKFMVEDKVINLCSDSFSCIGVVWEVCDFLIVLEVVGIVGLVV